MLALSGCGDFLDEHTSSRGYVRSLDDINELILGEGYLESAYLPASAANFQGSTVNRALPGWIHVMDDDSEVNNNSAATNLWVNAYGPIHAWQEIPFMQPTTGIEVADPTWSNLYERIGSMNAILVELDEKFTGQEGFERTRGEVLFLRAFYYFYLVNFYALPYDKANDGADPGIPLKTSGKVDDKNYDRGTVKMVYDLMIDDLGEEGTLLGGDILLRCRGNAAEDHLPSLPGRRTPSPCTYLPLLRTLWRVHRTVRRDTQGRLQPYRLHHNRRTRG